MIPSCFTLCTEMDFVLFPFPLSLKNGSCAEFKSSMCIVHPLGARSVICLHRALASPVTSLQVNTLKVMVATTVDKNPSVNTMIFC